jgi:CRP/FNR family transcriptional regulator, cyclic AMP receptor protein
MSNPDVTIAALAAVPLFADLPANILVSILDRCRVRDIPRGCYLCWEGDPGNSLFVLLAGQVAALRKSPAGRDVMLSTVDAPTAFGELAVIDGGPRSASLVATRPSRVLHMPRPLVLDLLDRSPAFRDGLLRTLVGLVRAGNDRHVDAIGLDASARAAKWLTVRPGEALPGGGKVIHLDRSQSAIAAELGITRVRLNQILKSFEADRLVTLKPGSIVVLDEDRLIELYL